MFLVGRSGELKQCHDALRAGHSILLTGPGGIGKSALLETIDKTGYRVLRTRCSASDSGLPFLALLDLFEAVLDEARSLPEHLRSALDAALLRSAPGDATDQLAIRVAVLHLLRKLTGPVLLIIDDAHWMDEPSAQVLTFAARREPGVQVIVTERDDIQCRQLCPGDPTIVTLQPLSPAAIRQLLTGHAAAPVLDRICQASGGNPLYALELARSTRHDIAPDDPLPVPQRLRALLAERVGALPSAAGSVALVVAAAARPIHMRLSERDAAQLSGILVEAHGGLHFTHPLLAELVYSDAAPRARRVAHARLAALATDEVDRVRHRALAAAHTDASLGDELAAAAHVADQRGAPGTAATLSRMAAGHTHDLVCRAARLLQSADYARVAGLSELARSTCADVLREGDPAARVGAQLILAELADPAAVHPLLDTAAQDAGDDPVLLGRVHRVRAETILRETGIFKALHHITETERLAREAGDTGLLIEALALRVPMETQGDTGGPLPALDEAITLVRDRPLTEAIVNIRQGHAIVLVRRGQVDEAIDTIRDLQADVQRAGRTRDLCSVLYVAGAIYERAGMGREAAATAALCGLLWTEVDLPPAGGLTLRGAGELITGSAGRAIELLQQAVAFGESTKDPEWAAYAHVLLGRALLIRRDYHAAAQSLERGRRLLRDMGYRDPAMILLDADLVEALVLSGRLVEAERRLLLARDAVARHQREVLRLGLDRVGALLRGHTGDPRKAADELRAFIPARHAYPLEIARCLLTLGHLERRARRRAAARTAWLAARRLYVEASYESWRSYADEQVASMDEPSDLDERLIRLVCAGATNRAIAHTLHLSVKAVEAHLTRLYRRHGVSGRAELARLVQNG